MLALVDYDTKTKSITRSSIKAIPYFQLFANTIGQRLAFEAIRIHVSEVKFASTQYNKYPGRDISTRIFLSTGNG